MDKYIVADNNDYAISFHKSLMTYSFLNSGAKYNCNINIHSIIGSDVCTIISNDIEIAEFIDNIETFLNNPAAFGEVFFYFNITDVNLSSKCIQITRDISYNRVDYTCSEDIYLKIFDYTEEILHPIITIKMTDKIYDLVNSLYEEFIVDDTTGEFYNPNMSNYIYLNP